ncbi:hypothetical protein L7F22_059404 [Adiantum nelumboides]|nr:hypothetical protein [Adiantum nelumboides]
MEEDVAPRRRRVQRSPTPTKRKRSPHSPPCRESKKEEKDTKKKKERKRSPSSPSSSPSSSSDESGGSSSRESPRRGHRRSHAAWRRSNKLKKFKEGGKSISFLTYDGTFGATDKVLAFIQQFDATFGDEGFTESSKLRHVAMHFQKSARQWWASLRANGEAPRTWKNLRVSIMKQFLSSDAKDKVLTEWQSLKLTPYESIQKYVDKFWDLHLKATVYRKIDFEEQKQQFCAGLPEDMNEYSLGFSNYKIKQDHCLKSCEVGSLEGLMFMVGMLAAMGFAIPWYFSSSEAIFVVDAVHYLRIILLLLPLLLIAALKLVFASEAVELAEAATASMWGYRWHLSHHSWMRKLMLVATL